MWIRARLVRQNQNGIVKILIPIRKVLLIVGSEPVSQSETSISLGELQHAYGQVRACCIEAFPSFSVDVSTTVGGNACTFLPDGSEGLARFGGISTFLLQRGRIIRKHPSLTVGITTIRAKGYINMAIGQQQPRPVHLIEIRKCGSSPVERVGRRYRRRPTALFQPAGDIESMKSMYYVAALIGLCNQVESAGYGIDYRSRDDAYLGPFCGVAIFLNARRNRGRSRGAVSKDAGHPQGRGVGAIRIECVDAVMQSGHVHDVVHTLPQNIYARKVEWICYDETI